MAGGGHISLRDRTKDVCIRLLEEFPSWQEKGICGVLNKAPPKAVTEARCVVRVPRESAWRIFFHRGDNFVIDGAREGFAWLVAVLKKLRCVQTDTGEKKQMTCVIKWLRCWELGGEASTPGVQEKVTTGSEVNLSSAAVYRSACMRLGYLALGRLGAHSVAKECS